MHIYIHVMYVCMYNIHVCVCMYVVVEWSANFMRFFVDDLIFIKNILLYNMQGNTIFMCSVIYYWNYSVLSNEMVRSSFHENLLVWLLNFA